MPVSVCSLLFYRNKIDLHNNLVSCNLLEFTYSRSLGGYFCVLYVDHHDTDKYGQYFLFLHYLLLSLLWLELSLQSKIAVMITDRCALLTKLRIKHSVLTMKCDISCGYLKWYLSPWVDVSGIAWNCNPGESSQVLRQ